MHPKRWRWDTVFNAHKSTRRSPRSQNSEPEAPFLGSLCRSFGKASPVPAMNREGVERLCAVASRSPLTPLATRVRTKCTLRWSVAILIWVLSGSLPLAQYFLIDHRKHLLRVEEEQDELVLALQLLAWWRLPEVTVSVEDALGDLSHKARIQADQFLVRSLVAEFVCWRRTNEVSRWHRSMSSRST